MLVSLTKTIFSGLDDKVDFIFVIVYIMVMRRVGGGEDVRMSVTVGGLGQWWWWW